MGKVDVIYTSNDNNVISAYESVIKVANAAKIPLICDIKAASRNKAKLPASRHKKSATAQAEANPALELALDPVATK